MQMSRRPINPSRRLYEGGRAAAPSFAGHSRSRSRPYLSITVLIVGAFLLIGYQYRGRGTFQNSKALGWVEGDYSCHGEVKRAIPILKEAYGDSMHKVLHVGPDTCSVVSLLLREEETEAWGVEPYDIEDADLTCKMLVKRGFVRVVNIAFPLPYRAKQFSLVVVSDALDYLSPKYLNRTIPEMARISSGGLVIVTRFPQPHTTKRVSRNKVGHSIKARNSTWWTRYFSELSLEEKTAAVTKFERAAEMVSYRPHCQIFHLKPYQ